MTDLRLVSRKFLRDFIDIYRESPCLWKVKSKYYHDKKAKNEAYERLRILLLEIDPDATRDTVSKKVNSVRTCFRKELRKVIKSQNSDNGPEDIYTPSLWYYDDLLFLTEQELPAKDASSLDSPDEVFPDTWSYGQNSPVDQLPNKRRKEEFESVGCSALSDSFPAPSNYLERSEDSKEFDAVGVNVAAKLKKMTSSQQIYAELLINKVLAKGLLNKLTEETDLSDF